MLSFLPRLADAVRALLVAAGEQEAFVQIFACFPAAQVGCDGKKVGGKSPPARLLLPGALGSVRRHWLACVPLRPKSGTAQGMCGRPSQASAGRRLTKGNSRRPKGLQKP